VLPAVKRADATALRWLGSSNVWTSYEAGNEANQIGHSNMASLTFEHGFEVRVGRRFGACRQWALEGVYWTLGDFNGYRSITHPSGVSTPLTTGHVDFNGFGANLWFDNAAEHRLWRSNELDNVELNLVRNRLWALDGAPWSLDWLLGVRYFRFEEGLIFASLQGGASWGQDNGLHEIYMDEQIENHLVGFQFGFEADYWLIDGLRLFVIPKLGIYNNHITQTFRLNLGDGTIPTTGGTGVPGTYPVRSSTNNVSFLGQLDAGLDWQFAPRWSLRGGCRYSRDRRHRHQRRSDCAWSVRRLDVQLLTPRSWNTESRTRNLEAGARKARRRTRKRMALALQACTTARRACGGGRVTG